MKTILVTGGAGFLGSHVAEQLFRNGHRCIVFDNLSGGTPDNIPVSATFINGDIRDEAAVNKLFAHFRFDAVVHCAAFASENLSHNCRLHTYSSIVHGSAVLVNAAVNHGVELFVSMSSIAVYGHRRPPFIEADPPTPGDPYGAAKACMEFDLRAASDNFVLKHVIFRPHNVIGVRQSLEDSTRNVASIFIRQALTGKSFTVFGDGSQTRAFSAVGKVAAIIAASVDRPEAWNRTFNVGGDRIMSVMRLAYIVAEAAGVDVAVDILPARNEVKHAHSYHGEVNAVFPELAALPDSIEDTIAEMVAEARKMPLGKTKPLPRIEIARNLPESWKSQT